MPYMGTEFEDKDGNSLAILQDFHTLYYQNLGAYAQVHYEPFSKLQLTMGGR